MNGTWIAVVVGNCVLSGGVRPGSDPRPPRGESQRLCATGLTAGYNLGYPEALDACRAAIEADPDDPEPHRLLGQAPSSVSPTPPPPDIDGAFREHLQCAVTLAGQAVKRDSRDADAHFQLGAAHSFRASYTARSGPTPADSPFASAGS